MNSFPRNARPGRAVARAGCRLPRRHAACAVWLALSAPTALQAADPPPRELVALLPQLRMPAPPVVADPAARAAPSPAVAAPTPAEAGWRLGALPDLLQVSVTLALDSPALGRADALQPGVLTLEKAFDLGAAYSVEAQVSVAQEDAQSQTRRAAWRQLGPKVDLRVATGQGRFEGVAGPTPSMTRGDHSVTVRQPLFAWGSWQEALRQDREAEAARLVRRNAESQAALDAAGAYLAVLQSALIVGYTAEYEELLRLLLRYMEERSAAGGASPADLDRVRSRVENARAAVSENRAGLVSNLARFERITGRVPGTLEIPPPPPTRLPGRVDLAFEMGLKTNLELRAARSLEASSTRAVRASEGQFLPRLDLEASTTQNRNPSGLVGFQNDSRVLVIMSWNVFNSGADVAQRNSLLAKQREFALRVEGARRRLRQELENAYSVLDSVDLRFSAVREEVQANRSVVAAFSKQLLSTNRQLLDVLDAYQRFYQSKVDLTNLVVTQAQVRLQVAHLLGVLRPTPETRSR